MDYFALEFCLQNLNKLVEKEKGINFLFRRFTNELLVA